MDKVLQNYRRLCILADDDPEFDEMRQTFHHQQDAVRELFTRLSKDDRALLTDYLGAFGAMDHRMVELACFHMTFSD